MQNTLALLLSALVGLCFVASYCLSEHYPPWVSFYLELASFSGFLLMLCARALNTNAFLQFSRYALIPIALAVIPTIQHVTGQILWNGDAVLAATYLISFGLACALGHSIPHTQRSAVVTSAAFLMAGIATLCAAIAVYQWLQLDWAGAWIQSNGGENRSLGNLGQPNHLATVLCMGVAACLYLHLHAKISPPTVVLIVGLLILGLVCAASRTSILCTLFLLTWTTLKRKTLPALPVRGIVLGCAIYVLLTLLSGHIAGFLFPGGSLGRTDFYEPGKRWMMWEQLWHASWQHPWFGYGWLQTAKAQLQVIADFPPNREWASYSHNVLLDLVVWNGWIIGPAIAGAFLFWGTHRCIRTKSTTSWSALLALGCVLIHALLEYPLAYAYFLLPIGFLMGLVDAEQQQPVVFTLKGKMLYGLIAICLSLIAWVWTEYRTIEEDYRLMRFETLRIGTLKAAQPAPDVILLDQLREDIRFARTQARPNMSADELAWMEKVAHRFPYYASLYRYSLALALNGRYDEATLELKRMCHMYPAKQCPIAIEQIRKLADEKYPQLRAWKLPSVDTLALPSGIHKT